MFNRDKKNSDDSWRKLKKSKVAAKSKRASTPLRARLRKVGKVVRVLLALAVLGGIIFGVNYVYRNFCIEDLLGAKHADLRAVEFKSDGVISAHWLGGILKIPKNSTLSDINIFDLKKILEDVSQIKSAEVERIYPDILRIEISELKPLAKIAVNVDLKPTVFMVATDGSFFKPICYTDEMLNSYVFLEGVKLDYGKKYENVKKFAEFIDTAKKRFPDEVAKWYAIDLSELGSLTLPLVVVTTRTGTKIIFDASDLKKQFDKFDYILRYSKQRSLNDFEKIDLSLKDRVDAKLRKNSR